MGSTQKYSLKWNDFGVNVASTFRDLHSRHDFVDVTLACSDGSTLEAHKVILSSVSSYFRDILKTTPCKHPIIILKDTGRDEASAMLEFAYTGEVNVAQELLPTLLHTARSFRIKGLDKVENPVVDVPSRPEAQTPSSEHWMESAPPTRSHTPSSIHSQHDVKPPQFASEQFVAAVSDVSKSNGSVNNGGVNGVANGPTSFGSLIRPAEQNHPSPPPSLPGSQPPTREASPAPLSAVSAVNARTPPPKRWKRSFDMSHPASRKEAEPGQVAEDYSNSRPVAAVEHVPAKKFCEPTTRTRVVHVVNQGVVAAEPRPVYPHSVPTSPTMFDRGNEARLAGFIRHHLSQDNNSGGPERFAGLVKIQQQQQQQPSSTTVVAGNDNDPIDYRCYGQQLKVEQSDFARNGNGVDEENRDRYRFTALGFRPESAPTVMDVSPECSLSGPPSVRHVGDDGHNGNDEDMACNGDDFNDSMAKAFSMTPDGLGRYTCDECGKIFKHPGSLQHHRHIHRGTHRCPSCGKAFSRRWDMERHLNKSKYGCPANRFSIGSAGSNNSNSSIGSGSSPSMAIATAAVAAAAAAASNGVSPTPGNAPAGVNISVNANAAAAHLELLAAASPSLAHNTTI